MDVKFLLAFQFAAKRRMLMFIRKRSQYQFLLRMRTAFWVHFAFGLTSWGEIVSSVCGENLALKCAVEATLNLKGLISVLFLRFSVFT